MTEQSSSSSPASHSVPNAGKAVQGEGNIAAGVAYQQETSAAAADEAAIAKGARKAAESLDGPEAAELERARRAAAAVKPG